MLAGAAALALLGGVSATACTPKAPVHEVDALLGQLDRARDDSQLAGNAAAAAPPPLAAALTVVAQQRDAHATALSEEITRMSGETPPTPGTSSASTSSAAATTTSGPPPKPPSAADVVSALRQSADGASLLATQQSGYRAGLLGSIAAACTAAATVALAVPGPTT